MGFNCVIYILWRTTRTVIHRNDKSHVLYTLGHIKCLWTDISGIFCLSWCQIVTFTLPKAPVDCWGAPVVFRGGPRQLLSIFYAAPVVLWVFQIYTLCIKDILLPGFSPRWMEMLPLLVNKWESQRGMKHIIQHYTGKLFNY